MSQPADADFRPASGLLAQLDLLRIEVAGPVLNDLVSSPVIEQVLFTGFVMQ